MRDLFLYPCINTSNFKGHRFMHHVMHCFLFIACFFYKFCFILVFVDLTCSVFECVQKFKNP